MLAMKMTPLLSYLTCLVCLPQILAQPARYVPWQRLDVQHKHGSAVQKREGVIETGQQDLHSYAVKVPLWKTALSEMENLEGENSGLLRRQIDQSQLAQILNELDAEFQSLLQLLAEVADNDTMSSTTASAQATSTTVLSPSAATTPSSSPSSTAFSQSSSATSNGSPKPTNSAADFDPMVGNLNFAYYSQTPLTSQIPLSQICNDTDIDVVVLSFLTDFFSQGGYPTLNLGSNCWAANAAQTSAGASGLIDCVSDGFAGQVQACRSGGKKILLSLGGAISNTNIPDASQAEQLANTLWNLFLGGSGNSTLRPFGSVILDGIDIDNETPSNSRYIPQLASSLRTLFASDTTRSYYMSAAPQCPLPDQSIPIPEIINYLDFINVQFYNNPSCELGSGTGFLSSVHAWSQYIYNNTAGGSGFQRINNGVESPRLMIGALVEPSGSSGYVNVTEFEDEMQQVKSMCLGNLGGVTYWDGAYEENDGGGYAKAVKEIFG